MTFSLLARDPKTGALGGVAATGNLCVGGWVLAGVAGIGVAAAQGQAPSTLWRERVLERMKSSVGAADAVAFVVSNDAGREHRQLTAFDADGNAGAFTGDSNGDYKGHLIGRDCIASGNLLMGATVLDQMVQVFDRLDLSFEDRLLAALVAGQAAGGDERGVLSAALLVVSDNTAPLTLRIDHHEAPIDALRELLNKTREPTYQEWLNIVPTKAEPHKFSARGPASKIEAV
ncbi:DUF1028 domain-containing protein [uncultured Roseibium sp.]|uniref:DUF1028 domain-containing protein n=1 Tax=uncultured Roseibium sp. TaxID=1936171 RepID=UPI0025960E33|nr:DUF1028 domain-containing protein [uncultured Roseibium sp.]